MKGQAVVSSESRSQRITARIMTALSDIIPENTPKGPYNEAYNEVNRIIHQELRDHAEHIRRTK